MSMNLLRYAASPLLNVPQVRLRRCEAASLVSPKTYALSRQNLVSYSG